MSANTSAIFAAKGRAELARSCARRSLAAETIFMAFVICCVFLTDLMRRRMSNKFAIIQSSRLQVQSSKLEDKLLTLNLEPATWNCLHAFAAATPEESVAPDVTCGAPGGSACGLSAESFQLSLKSPTACSMSALISSVSDFFSRMALRMPGGAGSTQRKKWGSK